MRSSAIFAPLLASTAFAATHVVTVGYNKSLLFEPNSTVAAVGDKIEFNFISGNHSVVSSSFSTPCTPATSNLIYSGFLGARGSNFSVDVTSTSPIYFYCSQGKHCQAGMVGAINPPSAGSETLEAWKAAAAKAEANVTPSGGASGGTVAVAGGNGTTAGTTASGTATGSAAGTATGAAAPAATTTKASAAGRVGACAGGVFAGALAVAGFLL